MTLNEREILFDGEKYGYDQSYINLKDSPIWHKRLNDIFKRGYKSGKLLDIGCNYGFFLRVCEPYFETYGVDISQYAIFQAKNHAPKSKILYCDVQKGMPFKNETFDVVTMFDLLEHLANYPYVLKEIYRILSPDGVFLLTTPNRWSMNSVLFGKDYWFKRDSSHVVLFSKTSLRRSLLEVGFGRVKIRTISFLHFLGDFQRENLSNFSKISSRFINFTKYCMPFFWKRISSPQRNSGSNSPQQNWTNKIPPSLKPALRKVYQSVYQPVNDLPTPWGANLYAFCKKQQNKEMPITCSNISRRISE